MARISFMSEWEYEVVHICGDWCIVYHRLVSNNMTPWRWVITRLEDAPKQGIVLGDPHEFFEQDVYDVVGWGDANFEPKMVWEDEVVDYDGPCIPASHWNPMEYGEVPPKGVVVILEECDLQAWVDADGDVMQKHVSVGLSSGWRSLMKDAGADGTTKDYDPIRVPITPEEYINIKMNDAGVISLAAWPGFL